MHEEMYSELCKRLSKELDETLDQVNRTTGRMSAGQLEIIDKLAHALKSTKTIIAMEEAKDDGYSNRGSYAMGGGSNRGSYADGGSYEGSYDDGSYARGRRRAPRDSMGRYSGEGGYSRADELQTILEGLPDSKRREIERYMESK